jgi:exonuclease VII large subunit
MKSGRKSLPGPDTCSVDPDFDHWGGELTFAQICSPPHGADRYSHENYTHALFKKRQRLRLLSMQLMNPIRVYQYRLTDLDRRLQRCRVNIIQRRRQRLKNLDHRMQYMMTEYRRYWRQKINHVNWKYDRAKSTGKIWQNTEIRRRQELCKRCRPYNGHHTPNYWGTGQKDPW